uniref:Uncharacterized protein n=1 Tax=Rhizophora mucronata TaxID=61149 RepID=A0A2P2Q7B6_RHIMU
MGKHRENHKSKIPQNIVNVIEMEAMLARSCKT